ncbi:MAG TPA: 2Fe-2S iron-sulfur cluster-binding protein [Phycisphaerae bacterium]|nr:2Fe-2S iron-sulfur cluster-binding protein [Phycisphaerae bacterium]
MPVYKVTFLPSNVTVEADPAAYPYGRHGEPGSVMDVALGHGIDLEGACGGAGVCGTCMVAVEAGMENLSEPTEDELDTIERQPDNNPSSRLACQAVVRGDVTVRV